MNTSVGDPISDLVSHELYLTRYLTHLCAPIFIFLAGVSAWLYANSNKDTYRSPSSFLFKRGLFLVLIEVFVYNLLWVDLGYSTIWLQVLWAIGVSMLCLSILCRLNYYTVGAIGLLIVFAYIVHLYIIFAAYWLSYWLFGANYGERFGFDSLGQIWLATTTLAFVLYYPARAFSRYKHKEKRNKAWLSYL